MNSEVKTKPISLLTMALPRIRLNAKYDLDALKPSTSFIKQQQSIQELLKKVTK
jgi:hypothetical protein